MRILPDDNQMLQERLRVRAPGARRGDGRCTPSGGRVGAGGVGAGSGPGPGLHLAPTNVAGALLVSHSRGLASSPSRSGKFVLGDREVPGAQTGVAWLRPMLGCVGSTGNYVAMVSAAGLRANRAGCRHSLS